MKNEPIKSNDFAFLSAFFAVVALIGIVTAMTTSWDVGDIKENLNKRTVTQWESISRLAELNSLMAKRLDAQASYILHMDEWLEEAGRKMTALSERMDAFEKAKPRLGEQWPPMPYMPFASTNWPVIVPTPGQMLLPNFPIVYPNGGTLISSNQWGEVWSVPASTP